MFPVACSRPHVSSHMFPAAVSSTGFRWGNLLGFEADVADAAYQVVCGGFAWVHLNSFYGRGVIVGTQD